jgi:DNA-binding CsgD family transcriptional regulator
LVIGGTIRANVGSVFIGYWREHTAATTRMSRTLSLLAIICVISWIFIVNLSGTFFSGDSIVLKQSACIHPLVASVVFCISCVTMTDRRLFEVLAEKRRLIRAVGSLLLILVSILGIYYPFSEISSLFSALPFLLLSGMLMGFGLALTYISYFEQSLKQRIGDVALRSVLSLTLAGLLFVAYMLLVPKDFLRYFSWAFPAVSLLLILVKRRSRNASGPSADERRLESPDSIRYATLFRSVDKTWLKEIRSRSAILMVFSGIAGFLLGYLYNMTPDATRTMGAPSGVAFGLVSVSGIIYLFVLCLALWLILLASKKLKKSRLLAYCCAVVVVFAVLFLALPFMKYNWAFFPLYEGIVSVAVLLSLLMSAVYYSGSDHTAYRRLFLVLMGGLVASFVVSAIIGQMLIVNTWGTDGLRDMLILGIPAIGFIGMMVALTLILFQTASSRAVSRTADSGLSQSALAARSSKLAEQFNLSPREREILALLAQGRSVPFIQQHLILAPSTIKTHTRHIYDKLGINSKQQLIDMVQLADSIQQEQED